MLGGTGFLGPHVVTSALARGHTVTLFNRGKTHPGLFPEVEKLHGDRDGQLEALANRTWDAVVDPSGYVPRIVKMSAELLARLTWADADFLDKQGVEGWSEMPMWIDPKGEYAGFGTLQNTRAVKAGLVFRPIGDTAKETLAWLETLPEDQRAKARSSGIKPDKEAKVLAAWKART